MNVLTINPIIVNGKRESYNDLYIPLDGSSSRTEIQMFQDWLDMEFPTWLNGGKLNKGAGYGTFGKNTSKAWASYGAKYTKENPTLSKGGSRTTPDTLPASTTPLTKEEKRRQFLEKAKAGLKDAKESGLLDKIGGFFGLGQQPSETPTVDSSAPKEESKTNLPLIIGGVVVLGVLIYFIAKRK